METVTLTVTMDCPVQLSWWKDNPGFISAGADNLHSKNVSGCRPACTRNDMPSIHLSSWTHKREGWKAVKYDRPLVLVVRLKRHIPERCCNMMQKFAARQPSTVACYGQQNLPWSRQVSSVEWILDHRWLLLRLRMWGEIGSSLFNKRTLCHISKRRQNKHQKQG
jgi:hypothetical protein